MDVKEKATGPATLDELVDELQPRVVRARVLASLDELFRDGRTPDPLPSGFLPGRLVTTSVWGPGDAAVLRIARSYMPWLGKSFDPNSSAGVNVLTRSAKAPMKTLWPSYTPERELDDRLECFPFRTRVAPGEVDPEVDVLKIDYDFDANPSFIIRHVLDELVEIGDGTCLGKILYRTGKGFRPIGFFSLERG
jgi:hypothetical protein